MSYVASAINHIGLTKLANRCGVYASATQKWRDQGHLPSTDLFEKTNYAEIIEQMTEGKLTAEKLLAETRRKVLSKPPRKRGAKRADVRAVG
jgi:hypothetical protein